MFRTWAGSVYVADGTLARRALVDRDGVLDHEPTFARLRSKTVSTPLHRELNGWLQGWLHAVDPAVVARQIADDLDRATGDLHHACLRAATSAAAGALGLDDPRLRQVVTGFVDEIFLGVITGVIPRKQREQRVFDELAARAGAALAAGACPSFPTPDPETVALDRHGSEHAAGELYLRHVTALVGATSVALAWLLYVLDGEDNAREVARGSSPRHVALEVLRLWPPAWQHRRRVAREHRIGEVRAITGDDIVVPTYSLHRSPALWSSPDRFLPERWEGVAERTAPFLPFAVGPRACIAAQHQQHLLGEVAALLLESPPRRLARLSGEPCVTAVLSPPRHRID